MKNVHFPAKSVHVGQNFVFFSSLLKDDPSLANRAQAVLGAGAPELDFNENSDNKMSAMVRFFDVVIARELRNEKMFLISQKEKFKDMPNIQEIFKYLDTNSFNYIDFIKMLNIALKGTDECKRLLRNELERIDRLQKEVSNYLSSKTPSEKKKFSEQAMRTSTLYTTGILTDKMIDNFNKTSAGISAEKIENAMAEIVKDPNLLKNIKEIIEKNYAAASGTGSISITNSLIVKYLTQALYNKLNI
jgi:hypothetical protein